MNGNINELTVKLLCSEIKGTAPDEQLKKELTPETLGKLYDLASAHDMAHIISSVLGKLGMLGEDEVSANFKKCELLSILRCERTKFAFECLCSAFEDAHIPFIPLKGSVIRPFYPNESMRTSCDTDILVKRKDFERASTVVTDTLKYSPIHYHSDHDASFKSPQNEHFELHYTLLVNNRAADAQLDNVWEHAASESGGFRYAMSNDYLLLYHISHMAKHFLSGGCGIRSFVDLYIMETKMGIYRHCADEVLQKVGYYKFAEGAFALCDVWFNGKPHTQTTQDMQDYVLKGGTYGLIRSGMAVEQAVNGGKLGYLLRRIFYSYKKMAVLYPSLTKCPPLFPFYQVRRWFNLLFFRDKGFLLRMIKANSKMPKSECRFAARMCKSLGLKINE